MRKVLLSLQTISILIFLGAFIVSFFVVEKIENKSRVLVTEKVTQSTQSKLDFAEEALNSKAAKRYLEEYQIEVIRSEIDLFKTNPYGYVEAVTMNDTNISTTPKEFHTDNPLKKALFQKLFQWKKGIKSHFTSTFNNLITDIRIFLGTNVLALSIALFICLKSENLGGRSMALSIIVTIATGLSAMSYVNENWLLNVLLNSYAGYGYAFGIAFLTGWLFVEYSNIQSHVTKD